MRRSWILVLTIVVVGCLCGWATTQQVVQNGGFESGLLDSWTVIDNPCIGSPCSPWTAIAGGHSGSYSAESQGGYGLQQMFDPGNQPFAGLITQASLWMKTDSTVLFQVQLFYADGSDSGPLTFLSTAGTWHQFSFLDELQNGSGSGEFLTGIFIDAGSLGNGLNETTWLDDVSIKAKSSFNDVPEPASWLLLGTGLATLRWIRRPLQFRN